MISNPPRIYLDVTSAINIGVVLISNGAIATNDWTKENVLDEVTQNLIALGALAANNTEQNLINETNGKNFIVPYVNIHQSLLGTPLLIVYTLAVC